MLRSAAQVCVHHGPGFLRGLRSVLLDPMALFAQVLLYEDPLGDQPFALGVLKWPWLLEGGLAPGMGGAESCTKSWGTGGCLRTSIITTATAAHRHSSPSENGFLTEGFGTGGSMGGRGAQGLCSGGAQLPVSLFLSWRSFLFPHPQPVESLVRGTELTLPLCSYASSSFCPTPALLKLNTNLPPLFSSSRVTSCP